MRKLRDGLDGDAITDPFKIVETKVEKYSIHDVDTHWRMRKPKVISDYLSTIISLFVVHYI